MHDGVVLEGADDGPTLWVETRGAGVRVLDLTVSGGHGGVHLDGAHAALARVDVRDNHWLGVYAHGRGAEVDLTDVRIADTLPDEDGEFGYGLLLSELAALSSTDLSLTGNTVLGAFVSDVATWTATGSLVADTRPDDGGNGGGIYLDDGATVELEGATLSGLSNAGLLVVGTGTRLGGHDVRVEGTTPGSDGGGLGILAADGARVELAELDLVGNAGFGAFTDDAWLSFEDARVTDTVDFGRGPTYPAGIQAQRGSLSCTRCELTGNLHAGIIGIAASLTLADTAIRDSVHRSGDPSGIGIQVGDGSTLVATGLVLDGNHDVSLIAQDTGTVVQIDGLEVGATLPGTAESAGWGVEGYAGAELRLADAVVSDQPGVGVFLDGAGTRLDAEGLEILGTRGADVGAGVALQATGGAALTLVDSAVDDTWGVGVSLAGAGTTATLTTVTVSGGRSTSTGGWGRGVNVQDGATVELVDVTVEDDQETGVLLTENAVGTFDGLRVSGIRRDEQSLVGAGLVVDQGASLVGVDLEVQATEGPGVYVTQDGRFDVTGGAIADNRFAGLVLYGGEVRLEEVSVTDNLSDASLGGGVGVYTMGSGGVNTLTLDAVTATGHPYAAVWLDGGGDLRLVGGRYEGGPGTELGEGAWVHGNAVYAGSALGGRTETTGLLIQGSTLADSAVAVLLDGAGARLEGVSWEANTVDLVAQACAEGESVEGADGATAELCDGATRLVVPMSFAFELGDVEVVD